MLKAEFRTAELHQQLSNFSAPQILSKIEKQRSRDSGLSKTVVLIPAGARVVVVDGDIDGDKLLKIRYQEKVLLIRRADFRDALNPVAEPSTL